MTERKSFTLEEATQLAAILKVGDQTGKAVAVWLALATGIRRGEALDANIKTVQKRLRHSSASLTMDIYAHAIAQNDRAAADSVGDLFKLGVSNDV